MPKYSLTSWSNTHAILMLIASAYAVWNGVPDIIVIVALGSFGYLLWNKKAGAINWPNAITIFRLGLICVAISNLTHLRHIADCRLFTLMSMSVILDIVDGYIARKLNGETQLGFYLDLEVDAVFVLLMSFYFHQYRDVHIAILLPGLLRYLYKLLTMIIVQPDFIESKKPYASFIAGTYFVILLVSILLPKDWINYTLLIGGIFICFSFGVSFFEYLKHAQEDHSSEQPAR